MNYINEELHPVTIETLERYESYINPAMARLSRFMGLTVVEWQGRGMYVEGVDGERYLDFLGCLGTLNLGHCHPKVVEAVKKQLDRFGMPTHLFLSKPQADLAQKLAEITPGDLTYTFFCNSGTEAVEGALKLARLATGKHGVVATLNGFHGKTLGSLSATGRDVFRKPCEPLLPDFKHVPYGDAAAVEEAIDEKTGVVIVEPIQGEGGVIVPPDGYLRQLREICDRKNVLLIFDEVQTGMGRTGKMFCAEHEQVTPDLMTLAKSLGGGVMPIGAFIARPHVWAPLENNPWLHTTTFGGNAVACTAGLAAIEAIEEENLADRAREKGERIIKSLQELQEKFPLVIKEVRGRGLLIGLEFTKPGIGGFLIAEMLMAHILVLYTLNNPCVMRIEPPLIVEDEHIDYFLEKLAAAIEKADSMVEDFE